MKHRGSSKSSTLVDQYLWKINSSWPQLWKNKLKFFHNSTHSEFIFHIHQSTNAELFELPRCFTFRISLWFYAVLCASFFVLYFDYGDCSSSKQFNENQAFESMSPLEHSFLFSLLFRKPCTSVFQLYFNSPKFLKALPLMLLLSSISNKEILFIFSTNKVAAAEVQ